MSERGDARAVPPQAAEVGARFGAGRSPRALERLGSGHIHLTLRARFDAAPDLVLQRLNDYVFPDLGAVMRNAALTTAHLRASLEAEGCADVDRRVLRIVEPTDSGQDGEVLVRDSEGAAWRAWLFVPQTRSYDVVRSDVVAERGAHAFGAFAAALASLSPAGLAETIPGFHDTRGRLAALEAAQQDDERGRRREIEAECDQLRELGERVLAAVSAAGEVPPRVVHNDCKINNLLYDRVSDEPVCVVDLDTVMAGSLLADFGGLVRTAACEAAEDDEDTSRQHADPARFAALARGYLAGLGSAVKPAEIASLSLAGPLMALEDAARFLTDHLRGDVYYAIQRPGHNRIRGRAQLALAQSLWAERNELQRAVAAARPR
jgi:aminoglycoside phosphotransferase (APT) family kinase protein